jgi:outer membrane lipopolysaccharide assembly protein LptE/RlpB
MNKIIKITILLILLTLIASCGYRFGYPDNKNIAKIYLPYLKNNTSEPWLDNYFIEELKRELILHPNVKVVFENEAEYFIDGKILDFKKTSISYSSSDKTLEYRLELKVNIIVKNKYGKILKQKTFYWNREYASGYTGKRNFDVGASEAKKKEFLKKICAEIAGEIYHWLFSYNF